MLAPAEVAAGQLGRHYLQRYFLLIAFRCYLGANPVQVSATNDVWVVPLFMGTSLWI